MAFVPLQVLLDPTHASGEVTLVFSDQHFPYALVGEGTTLEHVRAAIDTRECLLAAGADATGDPASRLPSGDAQPAPRSAPRRARLAACWRWLKQPASPEARRLCVLFATLCLGALIGRSAP